MRFLTLFVLAVSVCTAGCNRVVPPKGNQPPVSAINNFLLEVFKAHGVDCAHQGEWIVFLKPGIRASGSIVREIPHENSITIQLDVRFELAPGRTIIESFGSIAQTREQAVSDALQNFTANSFHVLLAAFFGAEDDQVSMEEWTIGGRPRLVTIGNAGIKGTPPVQGEQLISWFKPFEEKLKSMQLGPGTHWVRLYYGQIQAKAIACEVLLDNEVWAELQTEMAAIDWPSGEDFYSVRVFLVVRDR